MAKRNLTSKTKRQIINSDIEQLSFFEKDIRKKFDNNPYLNLKNASENILEESDPTKSFLNVDELLFPNIRELLCNKIKSVLLIFFVAIITSIVIELALNLASYVFNPLQFDDILFTNGIWLYYGFGGIISYFAFWALLDRFNLGYLFKQKIIFSIIVGLFSWIFGFNQNITSYYGNILMLDDIEYVDDGFDDYDPIYGSSSGGYVGEYMFFIPEEAFQEGVFKIDNKEFRYNGESASLAESEESSYDLKTRKIRYWEYAYCEGYEPLLDRHNVKSKSIFYRMAKVTPKYFLEILINKGLKGVVFALYILALVIWKGDEVTLKAEQ